MSPVPRKRRPPNSGPRRALEQVFGLPNTTLSADAAAWDALLAGSYEMLDDAQCEANGLLPNWWEPRGPQRQRGRAGCNASGTPADEFGAEAARIVWRVAVDALWWSPAPVGLSTGGGGGADGPRAHKFTQRVARQVASRVDERAPDGGGFQQLQIDASCDAVPSRATHPFIAHCMLMAR